MQIPVSNDFFGGDPCHLTPKHLSVAVNCSAPQPSTDLSFNLTAWQVKYPFNASESSFTRWGIAQA
jgi:hypothetical protein